MVDLEARALAANDALLARCEEAERESNARFQAWKWEEAEVEKWKRLADSAERGMTAAEAAAAERDEARQELLFVGEINKALMPYQERAVRAEARVAELEAALRLRLRHGHNDTCSSVLGTDEQYPCSCGHAECRAALQSGGSDGGA